MKTTLLFSLLLCSFQAFSQDWSSCEYDLSRLERTADYARDIAMELESLKSDYEDCIQYPDIYDFMNDNCESNGADYNYKLSELDNEMNELMRRVKGSISSCGYQ